MDNLYHELAHLPTMAASPLKSYEQLRHTSAKVRSFALCTIVITSGKSRVADDFANVCLVASSHDWRANGAVGGSVFLLAFVGLFGYDCVGVYL